MTIKIRTEEGHIGSEMKTKRKKVGDTEANYCSLQVQIGINRRELEQLAGFPERYADHFYSREGIPYQALTLLIDRELDVKGTLSKGDDVVTASLPISKAIAAKIRFKLEHNGAAMICNLEWRSMGDEVEEVQDLLGGPCDVSLDFKSPGEQKNLKLNNPEIEPAFVEELAGLGIDMPADHDIWTTLTPAQLSRLMAYVEKARAGESARLPAFVKPFMVSTN